MLGNLKGKGIIVDQDFFLLSYIFFKVIWQIIIWFSFLRLLQEREIIVYCDLHGHSRKQNVFIYGCENRHNPEKRLKERVFPLMLNKNAPDKVRRATCSQRY